MEFPEELKYSREHVWVRLEAGYAVIGITDFAQEELGLVSGAELPEKGDEVEQDDSIGSIEARKTVAEFYAPFSGIVREINNEVLDNPGLINDDPYDSAWLAEVSLNDLDELKGLMSAEEYREYVENGD
jgi:glycine cleavage system H protein